MTAPAIAIREYKPSDQPWFEELNRAWIEEHFVMEPVDVQVLQDPQKYVLENGGRILIAEYNGQIAGTVAIKRVAGNVYELTKMAVSARARGNKIGNTLAIEAMALAKNLGATKIVLYSNRRLVPAINLYRKIGFREVPVDCVYKRSDIKMEYQLKKMEKTEWFKREFKFGAPSGMLPYFLERLEGTMQRILYKVRDIPENLLSEKLQGKWSVKQNIGHLAEVDEVALKRIGEMIDGVSPMSPAVFEPKMDYNSMTIDHVLELFHRNRKACISKFDRLTPDELTCSSLHPRLKLQLNPVDLAYFNAEHDDHHLVRITEILNHLKP